jgi:hypothetical protein
MLVVWYDNNKSDVKQTAFIWAMMGPNVFFLTGKTPGPRDDETLKTLSNYSNVVLVKMALEKKADVLRAPNQYCFLFVYLRCL